MNKVISIIIFFIYVLNADAIDYAFKADYGIAATWNANDAVGIFAKSDYEMHFTLQSIDATNKHIARVYGNGVSLLGNNSYYGFCPYSDYYYLHASVSNSLPISYTKLTQTQNNSISHIAPLDFMVANVTTTTSDQATFSFDHLGCVLRLSVKVPDASTFNSVTLQASKGTFMQTGVLNIENRMLSAKTSSSTVQLTLSNIVVGQNGQLTVFFILPASNLAGSKMSAVFTTSAGKSYKCSFDGQDYMPGKLYNVERTLGAERTAANYSLQAADETASLKSNIRKASSKVTYPTCVVKDFILASNDVNYAPPYILGDANEDGRITICDLVSTIQYLNKKNPLPFNEDAVDINQDGKVNINDISYLVNMLLSK